VGQKVISIFGAEIPDPLQSKHMTARSNVSTKNSILYILEEMTASLKNGKEKVMDQ
jgi:hypothetical protein